MTLKYFDAFAGVGGNSLGIERAYEKFLDGRIGQPDVKGRKALPAAKGITRQDLEMPGHVREPGSLVPAPRCVGVSEIDKHASAVLCHRFPAPHNYGDIQKIDWSRVADFDLLVGGSPCQNFSFAGNRQGLSGAKSGLFTEYVRCLREKKPRYFIFENVEGCMRSSGGLDFAVILDSLAGAGYAVAWQICDAVNFGVAQSRRRVFVTGYLGDVAPPKAFPEREGSHGHAPEARLEGPASKALNTRDLRQDPTADTYVVNALVGRDNLPSSTQRRKKENLVASGLGIRRLTIGERESLMGWPHDHTKWGRMDNRECKNPHCDALFPDTPEEAGDPIKCTACLYEIPIAQRVKQTGNGVVSDVVAALVLEQIYKNL